MWKLISRREEIGLIICSLIIGNKIPGELTPP
jgi:hypothetical protein